MRFLIYFFSILLLFFNTTLLFSLSIFEENEIPLNKNEFQPWFTGPIIAGSGRVVEKGHLNLEPYLYVFDNSGFYNNKWNKTSTPTTITVTPLFVLGVGLNSFIDLHIITSFDSNFSQRQSDTRFSDLSGYLGFQVLVDNRHSLRPDLRVILSQDFPTGHYQHLNPQKHGTDISGTGFYKTGIACNFQKIFYFKKRLLRGRFNFKYKIAPKTPIEGFTIFGGGYQTRGKIAPVQFFTADLAFEYTLTQKISLAFDIFYELQSKGKFSGKHGTTLNGQAASIISPFSERFSLAPAIEYNFSSTTGLIIGSWFSVAGKNAFSFSSGVIAFNYYH